MDNSLRNILIAVVGGMCFWLVFLGGTRELVDTFITQPGKVGVNKLFDPNSPPPKKSR